MKRVNRLNRKEDKKVRRNRKMQVIVCLEIDSTGFNPSPHVLGPQSAVEIIRKRSPGFG